VAQAQWEMSSTEVYTYTAENNVKGTLYKTGRCCVNNDTDEIILMHFSLILF
jgi:hypothetical protein